MKPSDLVKVKALEWRKSGFDDEDCYLGVSQLLLLEGNYVVSRQSNEYLAYHSTMAESEHVVYGVMTEAEAKAACQAHYESMIYQLLEVR